MKAVYIRTSTDDQNPLNQIKDCEQLAGKEYTLFSEQQSAWNQSKKRLEFDKLTAMIKKGNVTDLYVWDWDRLYRNRKKLIDFFKWCKAYECKIHSHRQIWFEDINRIPAPWNEIMHDLLLQVMGYQSEEESRKKGARVRAAMRKRSDGVYSYKGNKWGRKQLSTQKKNKIQSLKADGKSIRTIAKELSISVGAVHKYLVLVNQD